VYPSGQPYPSDKVLLMQRTRAVVSILSGCPITTSNSVALSDKCLAIGGWAGEVIFMDFAGCTYRRQSASEVCKTGVLKAVCNSDCDYIEYGAQSSSGATTLTWIVTTLLEMTRLSRL
jgi:hypothetical protein